MSIETVDVPIRVGLAYKLTYTNHAGLLKTYRVELLNIRYGTSKYYPTPRVLLEMHDIDRHVERSFDPQKIHSLVTL